MEWERERGGGGGGEGEREREGGRRWREREREGGKGEREIERERGGEGERRVVGRKGVRRQHRLLSVRLFVVSLRPWHSLETLGWNSHTPQLFTMLQECRYSLTINYRKTGSI